MNNSVGLEKELKYEQNRYLEMEDIGFNSPLYEIEIYNKRYLIAIGQEKKTFEKRKIYYYPVYLIYKRIVKSQIGVFEYESIDKNDKTRIKPFLDQDGDIDLNRLGDIILYAFADMQFFIDQHAEYTEQEIADMDKDAAITKKSNITTLDINPIGLIPDEDQEDPDNALELSVADIKKPPSQKRAETALVPGIFTADASKKMPEMLMEETKEDSKEAKRTFRKSSKNTWIESYMTNNDYDILETAANGDCFFDTIRLAFAQIGQITTVEKLRAILAKEVTDDIFRLYKDLYINAQSEKSQIEKNIKMLKTTHKELKSKLKKEPEKDKQAKIIADANAIEIEYAEAKQFLVIQEQQIEEYAFIGGIDTIDDLRAVIQTSRYWADHWAISTIERVLHIKMIILNESNYTRDVHTVLQCGELKEDEYGDRYSPNFYIMTSYNGRHYRLISYKRKTIFTFLEIPYDVKILITIKCIERIGGPYYIIQDFRNFRTKIGLDPDQGFICDEEEENTSYDTDTVFAFHSHSNGVPKPGKGVAEKIPHSRSNEFGELVLKELTDWRKKMHDDWITERISLEGLRWASATHYIEGSKFRKQNPDFYKLFSTNSDSEISQSVEAAKAAASKTGILIDKTDKTKNKQLRPSDIKIDGTYNEDEEREKILYAKFTQNPDLKRILAATKDAKLIHYIPKKEPETDCILMKIRTQIQNQTTRPTIIDQIKIDTGFNGI